MSKKGEEKEPGIIDISEYREDLEKEVAYHVARIGQQFPHFTKKYKHVEYPSKFETKQDELNYQLEEIRKCVFGDGVICGSMYFWYNYCWIRDAERGKIRPDFRVVDMHWFKTLEECQESKEWGVISIKRRRVGASFKSSAYILWKSIFNKYFSTGMNSKSENDSRNLFKNIKFMYQNLPEWMRPVATASDRRDFMDFSWYEKDSAGNRIKKGNQSTILSLAPVATAHEGNMYQLLVLDEAGKYDVIDMWQYSEDCLRVNTRRVGMPVIFGTVGDIGKEGRGIMEMWKNSDSYKLKKFGQWGYNGLIVDEYGNDRIEDSVRWVIYERERLKSSAKRIREAFLQKYPLSEKDAFNLASGGGIGDSLLIAEQLQQLYDNPPKSVRGWMRRKPDGGRDFVPNEKGEVIIYERPDDRVNGYIAACLPPGEAVLTDVGMVKVEDVNESHKLISSEGNPVDIKTFYRNEVEDEDIFKLRLSNTFRTTSFTGEHPILRSKHKTRRDYTNWRRSRAGEIVHEFDFQFTPSKDLVIGDWVKIPNLYKQTNDFDVDSLWDDTDFRVDRLVKNPLSDPDFWWLIGIVLGDGYAANDDYKIHAVFANHEQEYLDRYVETVERLFGRSVQIRDSTGCVATEFSFQQLNRFILKHFGRYSHGKIIPEWARKLSDGCKSQLLLGLIDSDGCVTKSKRGYTTEIVSVSLNMLEGLQDIMFSLGIISSLGKLRDESVHIFRGKPCNTKVCYHLRLGHGDTVLLKNAINDGRSIKLNKIVPSEFSKRKRPNDSCFFDKNKDYIYFKITDIGVSKFTGTVYNFECETNTYLTHHITVHNCDPCEDDNVEKTRDSSNMGFAIMSKPFGTDPEKICVELDYRELKLEKIYEQIAMLCEWYGCQVHIEMNKGGWRMNKYFEAHYPKLLALAPASGMSAKGGVAMQHGVKKTVSRGEQMIGLGEDFIDNTIKFIQSIKFLEQCKVYGDLHADDDFCTAVLWCLVVMQSDRTVVKRKGDLLGMNPTVNYIKQGGTVQLVAPQQQNIRKNYIKPKSSLFKIR